MSEHEIESVANSARRTFLKSLGGGILTLLLVPADIDAQESGGRHHGPSEQIPQNVGAWLHIAPAGTITVFTGKAEVGQNIRTSLTQAVADELRSEPSSIQLVMADTAQTPFDMGTFGSRTTPTMAPQLRKAAASARELLMDAAAHEWHVERNGLVVAGGRVTDRASGKSASFGDLARRIDLVNTIASEAHTTPATDWQVAGKALTKLNARAIVSGQHQYPSDIRRKEMLHGAVLRPASFDATLASVDGSAVKQTKGAALVRDGDFVGVTAPDEPAARKALASIRAEWRQKPQISNAELFNYLKKNPEDGDGSSGGVETRRKAPSKQPSLLPITSLRRPTRLPISLTSRLSPELRSPSGTVLN